LEEIRELLLTHVTGELNIWVAGAGPLDRLDVAVGMRMIAAGNYQPGLRQTALQNLEGRDHKFQALVRSPLTESQNAMLRIAPPRKVGKLGTPGQGAV